MLNLKHTISTLSDAEKAEVLTKFEAGELSNWHNSMDWWNPSIEPLRARSNKASAMAAYHKSLLIPKFKVGDGATWVVHTDRHAGTIVEVSKSGKKITLQRDTATRLTDPEFLAGGFSAHCTNNNEIEYSYEQNPEGAKSVFTLRANGEWKLQNTSADGYGNNLIAGRREHYDYNF
jgi:hypothetical protein